MKKGLLGALGSIAEIIIGGLYAIAMVVGVLLLIGLALKILDWLF